MRQKRSVMTVVAVASSLLAHRASAEASVASDSGRASNASDSGAAETKGETERTSVPPIELGAGLHAAIAFGNDCRSTSSDVSGCGAGGTLFGFHLAPRWRLSPEFSVGALGGLSWSGDSWGNVVTKWFTLEAEGRWHVVGAGTVDPWIGIDAGVVLDVEGVPASDIYPANSFTQAAPMVGGGIGIDIRVASFLMLSPEVRGFAFLFHDGNAFTAPSNGESSIAQQNGVMLSMSGTFLGGSRSR